MLKRAYRWLGLTVVALSLAVPSAAMAQDWLSDRARAEGPGIRAGDFELHPGLGAEIGYDSNVFFDDEDPVDGAILRATAHLLFSTLTAQRMEEGEQSAGDDGGSYMPVLQFRGGLSGSYYHFFVDEARDNVEADVGFNLDINASGNFAISLNEQFGRTIRPFVETGIGQGGEAPTYARDHNLAGIDFTLRSRADILKLKVGYAFAFDYFEDDVFNYVNSLSHIITEQASWKFLPQTAILQDLSFTFQNYPDFEDEPTTLVSDNTRIRARVGLNGAFTNMFSLTAMVGYSAGFYEVRDDFEGVIGTLEARWQARETLRLALGYERDYDTSFIGNFYREDKGYANAQLLLAGRLLLAAEVSAGYVDFGTPVAPDGMTLLGNDDNRTDVRLVGSLFAEYRVQSWLAFNTTLRYTADFTDFEYTDVVAMSVPDPAEYNKFEAWFGARVFY